MKDVCLGIIFTERVLDDKQMLSDEENFHLQILLNQKRDSHNLKKNKTKLQWLHVSDQCQIFMSCNPSCGCKGLIIIVKISFYFFILTMTPILQSFPK